ncbi:MAG TPA: N-acetylmuramoyl-L-alanine amidase [Kofleriaceae bacterium]|nr:N-acetylmuramoyl-L-alanine amidase [Kofleriaceae bacterium]
MDLVVIDPGHGGTRDVGRSTWAGVRGPGGTLEKDVALELARRVAEHLGGAALLTRQGDENLSLAERAEAARRLGAAAFVSIHLNAGPAGARGAQAFVHERAGAGSRALAQALAPRVEVAELAVLTPERLPADAAACLLEVDYLSDPAGERSARDPRWLDETSRSIASGVRRYLGGSAAAPSAVGLSGAAGVSAFPFSIPDPFVGGGSMQIKLDAALQALPAIHPVYTQPIPIAIVALSDDPQATPNEIAMNLGDQTDYIASVAKVYAMYAAYELRRAARDVAQLPGWRDGNELKELLDAELDPQIYGKVATITPGQNRTPIYRRIFDLASVTPGTDLDFTADYWRSIQSAIQASSDANAEQMITPLGFQYLNGALADAGFFDPIARSGLWLTGDFVGTRLPLFNSHNDGPVAQAGSPRMVAKMFTLIAQRALVDPAASDEMLDFLGKARASWLTVDTGARSFTVTHQKIGHWFLKTGADVYSEGAILTSGGRRFVVAWQDLRWTSAGFNPIAELVERTIA